MEWNVQKTRRSSATRYLIHSTRYAILASTTLFPSVGAGQGSHLRSTGQGSITGQGSATPLPTSIVDDQFQQLLPRIAPLSPADSLLRFTTKPGYKLELAASEPNIVDPVAIAFDEYARMYVVEMVDYSEQSEDKLGVVKLLVDKNGDGFYESSTIFASGLSWPTAIACYDQGVFVGAAPDVLFLKDTDNDGVADVSKKIFTGFGRKNVQGLVNSFRWGLDNRIYGQTSVSGGIVSSSVNSDVSNLDLNGKDFSFDPKKLDLKSECGGGQHGMSIDDYGNRFTCHNSDNLQVYLYDHRYELSPQIIPLPPSRRSIATDGPQANVYRTSPVEPWRILRTNLRVSGVIPGLLEGGGKPSGYFTSATGVTIYNGNQMPELYGQAFIADVGSNLIHRKKLSRDGAGWKGERIDIDSEFIASSDTWFRPVQFSNAPDGCLYILDFYREVIEHPLSLPDSIKRHLDLTNGRDKGRIYRVRSESSPVQHRHNLGALSPEDLAETLYHPNGWHRETARRLLSQHWSANPSLQDNGKWLDTIERLANKPTNPNAEQGRAGGLDGLGLLANAGRIPHNLDPWLNHPNPNVRAASIRLLEPLVKDDSRLRGKLYELAKDTDAGVRFQLALTLSQLPTIDSDLSQRELAVRNLWMQMNSETAYQASVANLLKPFAGSWLLKYLEHLAATGGAGEGQSETEALASLQDIAWNRLGFTFATAASTEELQEFDRNWGSVTRVLHDAKKKDFDSKLPMTRALEGILEALSSRRGYNASSLIEFPSLKASVTELVARSTTILNDEHSPLNERLRAIEFVSWADENIAVATYVNVLQPHVSLELQMKALELLGTHSSSSVVIEILERYQGFTPALKGRAIDILVRRTAWLSILLTRLEQGTVNWDEFSASQRAVLQNHPVKEIRQRVAAYSQPTTTERTAIIERYQNALAISGDITAGKVHFTKLCAACHRVDGIGHELGPNLSAFRYRGPEAILQNVLDPNREVNPMYLSYIVRTHDDQTISGMIESESSEIVNLTRGAEYRDSVKRSDIAEMKSSRTSIMPEGFENQLDVQGMADLLAYLMQNR